MILNSPHHLSSMFSFAKKLVDKFEGTQTNPQRDLYFKNAQSINNNGFALRVLSVVPHSPAQELGLESWFDYIVKINNHDLPMMYPSLSNYSYTINDDGSVNYGGNTTMEQAGMINFDLLAQEISTIATSASGAQSIILDVWSAKGGVMRQVTVPISAFEADATPATESVVKLFVDSFQQIGVTVQSQHINTATYVWRILNTHPGSPAFQAQLVPYSDYIIGCDSAFPSDQNGKGLLASGGETLLSRTVLGYYNHHYATVQEDSVPITLYVYNHDYDILRPVTVNLSRSWSTGNKGILGCDVGYGLLHRIPEVVGKFGTAYEPVDDVLFENNTNYGYVLDEKPASQYAPADALALEPSGLTFIPQVAPIAPPPKSSKKKRHHVGTGADLTDFMNEELTKSKESDVTYAGGTSEGTPPPPPKKVSN